MQATQPSPTRRTNRKKPGGSGRPRSVLESATTDRQARTTFKLQSAAHKTFCKQLPELLREHAGQWVAFRGRELVGTGRGKSLLLQACYQRGFQPREILVRLIRPGADEPQTIYER
jgi:hypothetical protein